MDMKDQVIARLEATTNDLTGRNLELHTVVLNQIHRINTLEAENRRLMVQLDKYETGVLNAG